MLFLAVERTPSAMASLWLCFQAIWKRFIISRKCWKVFILKTSSERVSVCVRSCSSVAAEKAAASIHRAGQPCPSICPSTFPSTCSLVSLLSGFSCSRGRAVLQDQGNAPSWSKDRRDSFHPSQGQNWEMQMKTSTLFTRGVSLKPWHRLNFWWLQQGILGWVTVPAHSGCWIR